MDIKNYIKSFNKPFEDIKALYKDDFNRIYEEETEWLGNLENKTHILKKNNEEVIIKSVIDKLKKSEEFTSEDTNSLSIFIRKINSIVLIANRINNFKEGVDLENGTKLELYVLFNNLKNRSLLNSVNFTLNSNLDVFLPHLYSIVKHCQNPNQYPIYYKYWKNILREVLGKEDDYDNMCEFYREFPDKNRQLSFATYLGTIGIQIAKQIGNYSVDLTFNSKEYKYLKKDVINIEPYYSILDQIVLNNLINMKEEFKHFLNTNNKKGSQKASSYIRSLELLDNILTSKAKDKLEGFKSIYNIDSIIIIERLHLFILKEQKDEKGIFENEEPISYWRDRFYSAAIKSYLDFLNYKKRNVNFENDTFSISQFHQDCTTANLKYSNQLVTRYISSLVTKPFVLLSGLSGSGKTKLAQAFSQWICEDESQYCIVPVGADWTNREPLLGYVNALNNSEYIVPENGALQLLIDANNDQNKPYFLILDEMNLSHVERYFADFLSVMESKDNFKLHSDKVNEKSGVPHELSWPKNLFVVGTVNIDETTYMFSPKVLDRANVIEFRINETEMGSYLSEATDVTDLNGEGKSMGKSFVTIATEKTKANSDTLKTTLNSFFSTLQEVGAEFGYRTASEIQTLFGQIDVVNPSFSAKENEKIDIAIMQKLLPKLHGSRSKLTPILKTLAVLCYQNNEDFTLEQKDKVFETVKDDTRTVQYPISLEKITRMYHNVIANGFTSYAEA
jgi:energy-coupling factor transporter ATP-binding protein EcfA2